MSANSAPFMALSDPEEEKVFLLRKLRKKILFKYLELIQARICHCFKEMKDVLAFSSASEMA